MLYEVITYNLPVIRKFRVEKTYPYFRIPLPGKEELIRSGQLQGARSCVGELPNLDEPFSRDEHASFPQEASELRYLLVRNRKAVPVRRHHAQDRLPFLFLPFQEDSRKVVSRLVTVV